MKTKMYTGTEILSGIVRKSKKSIRIGVLDIHIAKTLDGEYLTFCEPFFWKKDHTVDNWGRMMVHGLNSLEEIEEAYNAKFLKDGEEKEKAITKSYGPIFPLMHPLGCLTAFDRKKEYELDIKPYKRFLESKETFIIYLPFGGGEFLHQNLPNLTLPEDLQEAIKSGQCRIVMGCYTEGVPRYKPDTTWLERFVTNLGIPDKGMMVITANLSFTKICSEELLKKIVIEETDSFEYSPWFPIGPTKTVKPDRYFTCLSRRMTLGRLALASHLTVNRNLANKSYCSLGNPWCDTTLEEDKNKFYGFARTLGRKVQEDIFKHCFCSVWMGKNGTLCLDDPDGFQKTNHASDLSEYVQKGIVNIVPETLESEDVIFFSEKIWKPIFCKRPFILLAAPGSLKRLHEFGYKTFSQFWDESYDFEPIFARRLERIIAIVDNLAAKPFEELEEMFNSSEMQSIINNNYSVFKNSANTRGFEHTERVYKYANQLI